MKKILVVLVLIALTVGVGYAGGRATLIWDAPTTYNDGTPIMPGDITSYKVYRGSSPGTYSTTTSVPSTTRQLVVTVPTGTFYFVVTSVTREGAESDYSNEVFQFFPAGKPSACTLRFQ